jgi:hypothetical protein
LINTPDIEFTVVDHESIHFLTPADFNWCLITPSLVVFNNWSSK